MTPSDDTPHAPESVDTPEAHIPSPVKVNFAPERTPDQHLVHRLRGAIDKTGRYSYRLNDMAAGYGAARGVKASEARQGIEQIFVQEFGMSPHQYLDRHYAARRENAPQNGKEQSSSRSHQMDNER